MSWTAVSSIETKASREKVWELWKDVKGWPLWDQQLEWAKLEGEFEKGTSGSLKPQGWPEVKFTLVEVEPLHLFSNSTVIMGTTVTFVHKMILLEDGRLRLEHKAEAVGPASIMLRVTMKPGLEKHLPKALEELVRLAECVESV